MKKDLKNIENLKEVNKDKSADRAVLIAGVIVVILMLGGIYLYRGYVTKKSMIENKVTEHMKKVEEGKKILSEKMDRKVLDLKKEMEPLLDKKDDIRMKTADYFGIAKEIDWTVPVMVIEEEKESKEYMDKWRAEYCNDKKHKEQCIKTPSYNENPNTRIFNKKTSIESCKYLKEMDEKYEALGDNPGFKYPIFTVYRQYTLNHKGCAKKGIYPENTRLQKLISEEQKIRDKFFTSTDEDKRLKYLKRELEMEQEKNEKLMKKW